MQIAVIGAGIAGLACAKSLVAAGHRVIVFERCDFAGGRVSTHKTEIGGFDHGAQYFTARHPAFVAETQRWSAAGIVEPWAVVPSSITATGESSAHAGQGAGALRWVGVPAMATIATHLVEGLDVRYGLRITAVRRADPRWTLAGLDEEDRIVAIDETFDAVVTAVPPVIAEPLLAAAPTLALEAAGAHIEPCWALLAGFTEPVMDEGSASVDCAFIDTGRLAWIARESGKPERRPGERWTIHAQSAWSVEHFDDDPADIQAKLLRAFQEATGTREQPIYATVHRWRYALARRPLTAGFLWDATLKLGACGDWCRGFRVEDAWLSGTELGETVGK